MNTDESLTMNQAFPFRELKRRPFAGNINDSLERNGESINNYLKTLAEIETEMISAGPLPVSMNTIYTNEPVLNGDVLKNGNNAIVSPDTLYHGFMEENY